MGAAIEPGISSPDTLGAAYPQTIGSSELTVQVDGVDPQSRVVTLDIEAKIKLPRGTGFVYLPLPASRSGQFGFSIDPVSSYNDVFVGHLRPENDIAVIAVSLRPDSSILILLFENVSFPYQVASGSSSDVTVQLLIDRAFQRFLERYPQAPVPVLRTIVFRSDLFQTSRPEALITDEGRARIISIPEERFWTTGVVVTLTVPETRTIFYFFLGLGGLILGVVGFAGSTGFVTTKRKGIIFSIIAAVLLVAEAYVFFFILTHSQRTDTEMLATTGAVAGILIGLLAASIHAFIVKP